MEHDVLELLVRDSIAVACGCEATAIVCDARLSEIGLDSISLVGILAQVEGNFDCEFTVEDMERFGGAERVGDLMMLLRSKL
jgi:acyl carrier protein